MTLNSNSYVFREREGKCFIIRPVKEMRKDKKIAEQLKLISNNGFQWVYKDNDAVLTIEKKGTSVISATIETTQELTTVDQWQNVSNDGPLTFCLLINNYNNSEPWTFNFNYRNHLVLQI